MALTRWSPYRDWEPFTGFRNIQDQFNRLFDETFGSYPVARQETLERTWTPAVDIYDDKDRIVVTAELPGIKKEDVTIEIKDNVLSLTGERKHESEIKKENYQRIERVYGKFSRSFTLPDSVKVDNVQSSKGKVQSDSHQHKVNRHGMLWIEAVRSNASFLLEQSHHYLSIFAW
jgi:HSP20 family protein